MMTYDIRRVVRQLTQLCRMDSLPAALYDELYPATGFR
jgi:hypothetical protein